jgi:hypothetical protein
MWECFFIKFREVLLKWNVAWHFRFKFKNIFVKILICYGLGIFSGPCLMLTAVPGEILWEHHIKHLCDYCRCYDTCLLWFISMYVVILYVFLILNWFYTKYCLLIRISVYNLCNKDIFRHNAVRSTCSKANLNDICSAVSIYIFLVDWQTSRRGNIGENNC